MFAHVQARGFVMDISAQPGFTTFRRQVGDRMQVFDVQWDKYGKPRLVLNFGDAPAQGVVRDGQAVPPERIEVSDCRPMLRLQRTRGGTMRCWFQLRKPLLLQLASLTRNYSPDELALMVLTAFQEVEAWWSSREVGPHVHGAA